MIKLEVEELNGGFQIRHINRDRPPKVKFGDGFRFFTNDKFGDLALLARLVRKGHTINAAANESGVSISRAKRFLKGLGIPFKREKTIHKKTCDVCGGSMSVTTRRQKRHNGECKKEWTKSYYTHYVRP